MSRDAEYVSADCRLSTPHCSSRYAIFFAAVSPLSPPSGCSPAHACFDVAAAADCRRCQPPLRRRPPLRFRYALLLRGASADAIKMPLLSLLLLSAPTSCARASRYFRLPLFTRPATSFAARQQGFRFCGSSAATAAQRCRASFSAEREPAAVRGLLPPHFAEMRRFRRQRRRAAFADFHSSSASVVFRRRQPPVDAAATFVGRDAMLMPLRPTPPHHHFLRRLLPPFAACAAAMMAFRRSFIAFLSRFRRQRAGFSR